MLVSNDSFATHGLRLAVSRPCISVVPTIGLSATLMIPPPLLVHDGPLAQARNLTVKSRLTRNLLATGRNELSAHAALRDPVPFQNTLYRSPIVPRGQPRHHAFPHRSLQFSVLLQLTVALQFHFLAFARSDPRPFQRDLLPSKNHITRLLPPAHTAGAGIGPMRRSYPMRDFVFQNGAQDLQPGLAGQLFHLRLHLGPHLGYGQRHPHHQLLPSDDLKVVIGLTVFLLVIVSHGGSLL